MEGSSTTRSRSLPTASAIGEVEEPLALGVRRAAHAPTCPIAPAIAEARRLGGVGQELIGAGARCHATESDGARVRAGWHPGIDPALSVYERMGIL